MEAENSRKIPNDQIPERKPSYRRAVGANTTESQTKAAHFHNASITSRDPVVEFNSSYDGLTSSDSGKTRPKSGSKVEVYTYHTTFRTVLAAK